MLSLVNYFKNRGGVAAVGLGVFVMLVDWGVFAFCWWGVALFRQQARVILNILVAACCFVALLMAVIAASLWAAAFRVAWFATYSAHFSGCAFFRIVPFLLAISAGTGLVLVCCPHLVPSCVNKRWNGFVEFFVLDCSHSSFDVESAVHIVR